MTIYCYECQKRITKKQESEQKKCRKCKAKFDVHTECLPTGSFACEDCKQKSALPQRIARLVAFCILFLTASYAPYKMFQLSRAENFVEPNILVRIVLSWMVSTILLVTVRCGIWTLDLGPGYIYRLVYG